MSQVSQAASVDDSVTPSNSNPTSPKQARKKCRAIEKAAIAQDWAALAAVRQEAKQLCSKVQLTYNAVRVVEGMRAAAEARVSINFL